MKVRTFGKSIRSLALSCLGLTVCMSTQANDWVGTVGWWNEPANWNGGIPNDAGGWAIGNIGNGGTAIVTNTVPNVSEAWAGNSGVAGTIIVTNGGTLPVDNWLVVGRTGNGGNTPMSTLIVGSGGVINKRGDGFIVGDGTSCTGQVFVTGTGVINVTGGWNGIGNGAGGVGYLTLQDNAVYNVAGQDWNIGDYGSGQGYAVIKDNATLNVSRFWVGKTDTSLGVLTQTGGAIVGATGGNEWTIGGENSGSTAVYGFYNLMGGTFSNPNNFQIGRYGLGVLYQSGGTLTQGSWCSVGRYGTGRGILYITGGQFIHTGTGQSLMVGEGGSRGEMTLAGAGSVTTSREFAIGNGGTGFVNLNGGTLTVPSIAKWGGSGYLYFNGGTVKPTASNPTFLGGLDEARVFSGNAIFDTGGFDIGVTQPLLGAGGSGVTSIPVSDGGFGYVAPPIVEISGDGIGAQAIAQVDTASGKVSSIVITCPGVGYSTVFGVNFLGGGASLPATAGVPVLSTVTSGGLIKNGAGTLTLSGANDYTGPTVVNAGTLMLTPSTIGAGTYSVGDGAGFGVALNFANSQLVIPTLALGSSTGATLSFDLGSFGNPLIAPLNVTGALNVNGTVTVDVADSFPQTGSFPLMQFGSRTGSGQFVLGSLPAGVQAHLATNSPNTLDLVITTVTLPRWDGQAGGFWDIGLTMNWTDVSSSAASFYYDGTAVLFDDAALGTTTVNLVTNVLPGSVRFTNANLVYTLTGTGKIGGSTGLLKEGTNTLTIANALNTYTGPTIISGGVVTVTNLANAGQPSALGAASAASTNLVLANGTLSYAGPAVAIDRGYSVQGPNATIDGQGDITIKGAVTATLGGGFVKTGPAKLTYARVGTNELSGGAWPGYNVLAGALVFDGSAGAQVNHSQNEFWVGAGTNVGASMVLTNTMLNIDSWLAVGRGNGSIGNLSTLTLYDSKLRSGAFSMGYNNGNADNLANQTLTLNGTSTFTNNGDMNTGESVGSTASVFLNGTSKIYTTGRDMIGWHMGATGAVTVADSAFLGVNAWLSIANEGGSGSLTLKNNANVWVLWDLNVTDVDTGDGLLTIQDNAVASANNFFIGKGIGSSGVVNQTGGSAVGLSTGNEFHTGFHGQGTWNLSGGSIIAPNHWFIIGRWADGPGTFNMTAGTIIHGTNNAGRLFRVGEDGVGILNLSGTGVIQTSCDTVTVGINASANGTVNLDGGVFQARRIIGGAGVSVFNFNGGLLRAGPNANSDFMTALGNAYVKSGGAKIDSGANLISIAQPLLDGGGNGGLTKLGTGALALNGTNTYTGPTEISAGTLAGTGVLVSSVTVSSNAFLAPGASVGTLSISNSLTLAAGSTTVMEIDKTGGVNDLVQGVTSLTYGGTLVLTNISGPLAVGDTFKLFSAATYDGSFTAVTGSPGVTWDTSRLAVDGTVKVQGTVSTTPINVSSSVSGDVLAISWPADHTGWRLLAQTNALSVGLSTNWVVVADSSTTNQVFIPINKSNGSAFFRLVYP